LLGTTIQTLKIGGGAEKSSDVSYATENVCDGYVSYLFLIISLNFLPGHYDRLVYTTKVI
jgi:hypothetical protein